MGLPGISASESAYLDRIDAIRKASGQNLPRSVVANVVAMAKRYPGMTPGTLAALGQSGIGPGPQADAVWQQDLAATYGKNPGKKVKLNKNQRKRLAQQQDMANVGNVLSAWEEQGVPKRKIERVTELLEQGAISLDGLNKKFHGAPDPGGMFGWFGDDKADVFRGEEAVDRYIARGEEELERRGPGIGARALGAVAGAVGTGFGTALNAIDQSNSTDPLNLRGLAPYREVEQAIATGAMAPLEASTGLARQNFGVQGVDLLEDLGVVETPGKATNPNAIGSGVSAGQFISQTAQQTTAYQARQGLDTGGGLLPEWDSPAMLAQADAARQYSPYLIGDHAWTLGRDIAGNVIGMTPDDNAFNIWSGVIDMAWAVGADPVALGTGMVSRARAAGKVFRAPTDPEVVAHADVLLNRNRLLKGGIESPELLEPLELGQMQRYNEGGVGIGGVGKWYAPKTAEQWRNGRLGRAFLDRAAATEDGYDIYVAMGRRPGTIKLADDIGKYANTPDQVMELLEPHLGTTIRDTFGWEPKPKSGIFTEMPGTSLPATAELDLDDALQTSDRFLVNIKGILRPDDLEAFRRRNFHRWAELNPASGPQRYDTVHATFETFVDSLVMQGIPRDKATAWFRLEQRATEEAINYGLDNALEPLINKQLFAPNEFNIPHPLFDNQFLNHNIRLPDVREIRRSVSRMAGLLDNDYWKGTQEFGDMIMQPWRRVMLMRPAWALRVIAEEQIRIAAFGMNSVFKHPVSYLGWMLGSPDNTWFDRLQSAEQFAYKALPVGMQPTTTPIADFAVLAKARYGKGRVGITGKPMVGMKSYRDALYGDGHGARRFGAITEENPRTYLREFTNTDKTSEHYPQAMVEELARTHDARLGRGVMEALTPEDAKAWFWDGDGAGVRRHMAEDHRLAILDDVDNPDLARAAADEQVDLIYQRLEAIHGENPALADAIATGKLNGIDLTDFDGNATKGAMDEIARMLADGESLPQKMRMRKFVAMDQDGRKQFTQFLDRAFDAVFENLMPRQSNYISRGPFDRQMYWMRSEELIPWLNEKDRARLIKNAEIANLDGQTISNMRRVAGESPVPVKPINLKTADELAGRYALNATKDLLYDLSEKSQFMDIFRLMFPFGEAFREVTTRWAKLVWNNPEILRRVEQGFMGATSPGSNAVIEATGGTPIGDGFFFKNQYNEMQFAFPGTEILTNAIAGVPVPLTGNVSGLNMIGNGMPGLGPMIQLPASWILPDVPETNTIRKWLFPYGDPDSNPYNAVQDAFLPTWARRFLTQTQSPNSNREYAGAVKDAMNYLASTGDYELQGPRAKEEASRLASDAKNAARQLYLIRGFGAAVLPTSPSATWLAVDKSGNLTAQWKAAKWFQDRAKKIGYNEAVADYYDLYGTKNFLLLQPKSLSTIRGADQLSSVAGSDWIKENPELADAYPLTHGLFAPDGEDFDFEKYQDQFANGDRLGLTPKQMLHLANERLANYIYHNALEEAEESGLPLAFQQAYLRQLRGRLQREYPGYGYPHHEAAEPIIYINEIIKASKDKRLADNPATATLQEYIRARTDALEYQTNLGLAGSVVSTAKSAALVRAYLRDKGEKLAKKNPAFKPIWETVFSAETEEP